MFPCFSGLVNQRRLGLRPFQDQIAHSNVLSSKASGFKGLAGLELEDEAFWKYQSIPKLCNILHENQTEDRNSSNEWNETVWPYRPSFLISIKISTCWVTLTGQIFKKNLYRNPTSLCTVTLMSHPQWLTSPQTIEINPKQIHTTARYVNRFNHISMNKVELGLATIHLNILHTRY